MEGISVLTDDAILYVLQHLDTYDRIAFANTCKRFREICMDGRAFRKVDLSEHRILRSQQTPIKDFFRDEQMTKHIRELNLNNHRVMTWKMNDHLEEFIASICPHLEALHVLNCGMDFQTLHSILKQAPKLTSLSWSLVDLKPVQDVIFLLNGMKSSDGMYLENIKHLHFEILQLKSHIQILNYLVLSHCKYLEELEIYMCEPNEIIWSELDLGIEMYSQNLAFLLKPSMSISDTLPHLHSLMVAEYRNPPYSSLLYTRELSNFICSVIKKKSQETKWKKFWIVPPVDSDVLHDMINLIASSVPLPKKCAHELHSVKAFSACSSRPTLDTVDDFKKLFQKIDDSTIKNLQLCLPSSQSNFPQICKPILRVGGHALKFLGLFVHPISLMDAKAHLFFNTLFSGCLNIKDLDLLECHFVDNICEALSKLKHLDRIQLQECSVCSKYNENQVDITKGNLLTFVENCQNITEFDVRGCYHDHEEFSSSSIDDNLMALAKLKKLKSLTLHEVYGIKQWTFLQSISEHCKFLTMLRISAWRYLNKICIPIILESAKFLKHLAIAVPKVDLGLEDPWKLLSRATNLERLCIITSYKGSLNVSSAMEMLKSLPRLHVLHLHSSRIENIKFFCEEMERTLKEEKSDYGFCFELVGRSFQSPNIAWVYPKLLPLNAAELCLKRPIMAIPTL